MDVVQVDYGLKAQKPIAQGNALGKRATRCAPYRGKSKCSAMAVWCFCPYRTQAPQCCPVPRCCLGLWAFGLTARGDIKSSSLWFFYWRSFVVQHLCPSMNKFASFFIKYSAFFLLDIQKLCTFALNYNYRRMSKLGAITHPQLLGNEAQGCCAARRNSSFFDTFNVEHWEHSNNLLTHTYIRRTDRLSSFVLFVYAREKRRVISIQKGDATK